MALPGLIAALADGIFSLMLQHQTVTETFALLGDNADDRVLPGPIVAVKVAKIVGDRRGKQCQLAFDEAGRAEALVGVIQGVGEVVKHIQAFNPAVHGSQRQFDFKDDAVAAVGVMQQQRLRCRNGQHAGRGLHGHHFDAEHIAGRRQGTVVNGTDAAKTAAVEAA